MPPKKFSRILKRKIKDQRVLYKIEWNNGSISYEPLVEFDSEMLKHLEKWELKQLGSVDDSLSLQDPEEAKVNKKIIASQKDKDQKITKMKIVSQEIKPLLEDQEDQLTKNKRNKQINETKREKKIKKINEKQQLKTKVATTTLQTAPPEQTQLIESDEGNQKSKIKINIKGSQQKQSLSDQTDKKKDQDTKTKNDLNKVIKAKQKESNDQKSKLKDKAQEQTEEPKSKKKKPRKIKPAHICVKSGKNNGEQEQNEEKDADDFQKNISSQETIQNGHQPKISIPCKIIQARKSDEKKLLEFLVLFEDKIDPIWLSQNEVRDKAPRALSEYLLGRISWNQK